jgi:hypothetical protein
VPQVLGATALAELIRQFGFVAKPLTGYAPINPSSQMAVGLEVSQPVLLLSVHRRPGACQGPGGLTAGADPIRDPHSAATHPLYHYLHPMGIAAADMGGENR